MKIIEKITAVMTVVALTGTLCAAALSDMTPYGEALSTDEYFSGATYILPTDAADVKAEITSDLERMKNDYNINTISLYDLENLDKDGDNTYKDHLFDELERLSMKAVVRIENYNASSFTFSFEDIDYIMDYYSELIEYVSGADRKGQVAYFALNMPVDDGTVQENLGGINSESYISNQVAYAEEFVSRMREATAGYGFTDAKMYLSVFYGWDNSYNTPSYTSAGADGYFINNYSYPKNPQSPPDAEADNDELINAEGLKKGIDKYISQYKDAPLVIEYGFHTLEYNDGVVSDQTAGLVADREAKSKALKAVSEFYSQYDFVRGMMYFGYNLYKEEGSNNLMLDWTLYYSLYKSVEAETGELSGKAEKKEDKNASGGCAVQLSASGDVITLSNANSFAQLGIVYTSSKDAELELYADGSLKTTVKLSKTDEYKSAFANITVMGAKEISVKLASDAKVMLDSLSTFDNIEAENSALSGGAEAADDSGASAQKAVKLKKDSSFTLDGVRGGKTIKMCYKSASDAVLEVTAGGVITQVNLGAAKEFTEVTLSVPVQAGENIVFKNTGSSTVTIDYINISGIAPAATGEENKKEEPGYSTAYIVGGVICSVVALAAAGLVLFVHLKRKKGSGAK